MENPQNTIVRASPYTSLEPLWGSFRVLVLLPGQQNHKIECELRVTRLGECPPYEVLSYLWGSASRELKVTLEGRPVVVTDNLFSALTYLRHPERERILWVDALCINQNDVEEKTQQVRLMGRIYEESTDCLIWVGGIARDDDDDDKVPPYSLLDAEAALTMISLLAADESEKTLPANLSTRDARKGAIRAIRGMMLFGNKWWKRIWTVQEAVLPKRKTIIWGTLSIPWDTCVKTAWGLMYPETGQRETIAMLSPEFHSFNINEFITPFLSLQLTKEEALTRPLWTAHRWRYREATDPRDKVYGLMGLFNPTQLPNTNCDYSLPPATVFTQFTLDLLQSEGTLSPMIGLRGEPHVTPNLPTWALDLVRPANLVNEGCKFWEHIDRYSEFHADKDARLEFDTSNDGSILILKGLAVDTVFLVDEGLAVDEKVVLPNEEFIHITKRRQDVLEYASRNPDGGVVFDQPWKATFWRTMLGDLITQDERVKRRVNAQDEELFLKFLEDGKWNDVVESLRSMILNQSFFVTERGHLGIGPAGIQKGDVVWVLMGGRVPFVLRPTHGPSTDAGVNVPYSLVGDAFVSGIMEGELLCDRQSDVQNVYLC